MSNPLASHPPHILALLQRLHAESSAQESALPPSTYTTPATGAFHTLMRDKFIALEQDKCLFLYQLARSLHATTIVEAGTSYGVSTIYLALAVADNLAHPRAPSDAHATGTVIATEYEPAKAAQARAHWAECGDPVRGVIDLREGDLRETLKEGVPDGVDLLLLDIWTPMALPTLKLVQPRLRPGAVIVADNTASSAAGYEEFLEYVRAPGSGFSCLTLPYKGGLEMIVYSP
ncbi:O-methyltransferase [Aspergillus clavatus NRRL 1]|uniref:O-methyltransferase, putative n=1 Tax=Aspergillus clavatus (strain ATCC 1007 / CBS 513.65 / DSM 816 / NCTC 3887 / NRRL 1 / QM 1276 / 107) TaxID=344612 RepID=A1CMZ6_ASPCL|nr:O-methyltransferase, putative [Aspergillus clavatus NRRL 1]EAW08933.1 O-methyltransferase, putative [Aspergillus clavatus NRRL 1]